MTRFVALLVGAFLLASCVTEERAEINRSKLDESTSGVVVLYRSMIYYALFRQKHPFSGILSFRNEKGEVVKLRCGRGCATRDPQIMRLRPGEYHLSSFELPYGKTKLIGYNAPDWVRFKVDAGEVVYIGDLQIDLTGKTARGGIKAQYSISGDAARARADLAEKYAQLAERMQTRLMQPD